MEDEELLEDVLYCIVEPVFGGASWVRNVSFG